MDNDCNAPERPELARAAELLRAAALLWRRASNATDPRERDALLAEGVAMVDRARTLAFGPV